ncbi:MAG: hypothetical protein OEM52_13775, partial [bacterium]|nr:hypothetical protein [bacterium]
GGMQGEYEVFDIERVQLADMLERCFQEGFTGLNVTAPYKEIVLDSCETIKSPVDVIGSANTLLRGETGWIAHCTDHFGVWFCMTRMQLSKSGRAMILGAGGSARAACFALLQQNWQVTISSRRIEQSLQVAEDVLSIGVLQVVPWELREHVIDEMDLLVQCTTIGSDGILSPLPLSHRFLATLSYLDVLYSPRETPLATAIRGQGATVTNGLPWLFGQAAESFQMWTGKQMPVSLYNWLETQH